MGVDQAKWESRNHDPFSFREGASCFREELFVILQVFADESDTYRGGPTPSFCGFVQTKEYWVRFSKKWNHVLSDYGATYFHFREFADKKGNVKNNPFQGWSERKRDSFFYDLALLCAEAAVPICASYNAKQHRSLSLKGDPYANTITLFFRDLGNQISIHWPNYRGEILLIVDACDNNEWLLPLNAIHQKCKAADQRIGDLVLADDKKHAPLQAADLFAYAMRQRAGKQMAKHADGDP